MGEHSRTRGNFDDRAINRFRRSLTEPSVHTLGDRTIWGAVSPGSHHGRRSQLRHVLTEVIKEQGGLPIAVEAVEPAPVPIQTAAAAELNDWKSWVEASLARTALGAVGAAQASPAEQLPAMELAG